MLKPTETSKKIKFLRKNYKNFKYLEKKFNILEKIAKTSSIWKKLQNFQVLERKLQKSHSFGYCTVASNLVLNILLRIDFKIEFRLCLNWHHVETKIQNFEQKMNFSTIFSQNIEIQKKFTLI